MTLRKSTAKNCKSRAFYSSPQIAANYFVLCTPFLSSVKTTTDSYLLDSVYLVLSNLSKLRFVLPTCIAPNYNMTYLNPEFN